ncbi:MAG: carbohydrate porin [Uliginosibacterium sp.]|nr:carbohydrate porin [Uliginosibacterium sp.]
MKKIHVLVGLALAGAFGAAQAVTADFSGYFRAGNALNTRGGMGTCFGLGGLQGQDNPKWRLGNECDYVIEPNFNATLVKSKDGSEWHVHFMPSSGRGWDSENAWNGNKDVGVNFGQVYGYGQNIAMLGKGTLWAGRRFYNRLQLGINDHFLENDDGDGVGLDDINLGGAKLSLGFMNGNGSSARYKSTNVKYIAKIGDIQTGGGSNLAIHLKVQRQSKTDDHSTTPATTTAKRRRLYVYRCLREHSSG